MVMVSYFETNEISLVDCMELFFSEKKDKSINTFKRYYCVIQNMSNEIFGKDVQFLRRNEVESLKWTVLNKYKNSLKSKNRNNTINNHMSAIKSFIVFLAERNSIDYNIAELNLISTLNDDGEVTEMIPLEVLFEYTSYFENHEQRKGLEKARVCLLALETGNRIQDLLSLKKNQFVKDGDDYILKSKGKNKGKGNKDYIKHIGSELYEKLMSLNPDSEKVFSVSYNVMIDAFHRANKHFGNEDVNYTPHSIRHLCARIVYNRTKDILAVKEFLNHDSIETTMRYLKIEEIKMTGLYTDMNSVKKDAYKESSVEDLISVIDDLPLDIQLMINKKLEDLPNTNDKI